EVAPASATSKSWISAAPFIATAVTYRRFSRSISTGASPHLMACPPSPQMIGLRRERARSSAATTARKLSPARMRGKEFVQARTEAPAGGTRAKSETDTLLGRERRG